MLQDELIKKAVSRILQRSEKQVDLEKLVGTFVDVGILPQLDNRNSQIIYGRRGTGKTHVLRVLGSSLNKESKNIVVYIDARTLGSTSQFSDRDVPLRARCLALFRDVLTDVYRVLLERVVEAPPTDPTKALSAIDELLAVINEPYERVQKEAITSRSKVGDSAGGQVDAGLSSDGKPVLSIGLKSNSLLENEVVSAYKVASEDKVIFPDLHRNLAAALDVMDSDLFIILDEWSSLPPDVQPFLAEFLKRGVVPVARAVLKIGCLEHRAHFFTEYEGAIVGFEIGADISANLDLDDYYVFDRNPESLTDRYADMLLRHLSSELPDRYLEEKHRIVSAQDLTSRMFTERATCGELARAAEGVARDLINIFTSAFFHGMKRGRDTIDKKAVVEAARQWFEQDKATGLDATLRNALRRIVDDVIGEKRARSFLLPRELEKHPVVQRLFDARVLHQMQRGYADKDNPGVRYNIYTLDYGTYVDLLGTVKQPDLALPELVEHDKTVVVPFDDKRSIRRIVLTAALLDGAGAAQPAS